MSFSLTAPMESRKWPGGITQDEETAHPGASGKSPGAHNLPGVSEPAAGYPSVLSMRKKRHASVSAERALSMSVSPGNFFHIAFFLFFRAVE